MGFGASNAIVNDMQTLQIPSINEENLSKISQFIHPIVIFWTILECTCQRSISYSLEWHAEQHIEDVWERSLVFPFMFQLGFRIKLWYICTLKVRKSSNILSLKFHPSHHIPEPPWKWKSTHPSSSKKFSILSPVLETIICILIGQHFSMRQRNSPRLLKTLKMQIR